MLYETIIPHVVLNHNSSKFNLSKKENKSAFRNSTYINWGSRFLKGKPNTLKCQSYLRVLGNY